MEISELKRLYPEKSSVIDDNIASGFTADEIFQHAISKGDVPPILNRLVETYGEDIRSKLYENIKSGFTPLELAQSLSKIRKPLEPSKFSQPIKKQLEELPVTAPEFSEPDTSGEALPIPANKFSLLPEAIKPSGLERSISSGLETVKYRTSPKEQELMGQMTPTPKQFMGTNVMGDVNLTPGQERFAMELPAMAATGGVVSKGISMIPGASKLVPAAKTVLDIIGAGSLYGAGKAGIEGKSPVDMASEAGREAGAWLNFAGALSTPMFLGMGLKYGFRAIPNLIRESKLSGYYKDKGLYKAAELRAEGNETAAQNIIDGVSLNQPEDLKLIFNNSVDVMAGKIKAKEPIKFGQVLDEAAIRTGEGRAETTTLPEGKAIELIPGAKDKVQEAENEISFKADYNTEVMNDARNMDNTSKVMAQNMTDVRDTVVNDIKNEGGFLGAPEPYNPRIEEPIIAKLMKGKEKPSWLSSKIKDLDVRDEIFRQYSYEALIKHDPWFLNQVRLSKDTWIDRGAYVNKTLLGILGPFKNPESYELWETAFALRDARNDIIAGRRHTLNDLFLEENGREAKPQELLSIVDRQNQAIWKDAKAMGLDGELQAAFNRHDAVHQAIGRDLEARGIIPPGTVDKYPQYYHHIIEDYLGKTDYEVRGKDGEIIKTFDSHDDAVKYVDESKIKGLKIKEQTSGVESYMPGVPSKMKPPFRKPYAAERKGTGKMIKYDYVNAESWYLSKIFMDNSREDWMKNILDKYDIIRTMTPEERIDKFGPTGIPIKIWENGKPYRVGTENYVAYKLPRGGSFSEDIQKLFDGMMADEGLMPDPIPSKLYLVPKYVADKLDHFKAPAQWNPVWRKVMDGMSFYKRMILDLSILPYQLNNFLGDLEALYRDDAAALFSPSAWLNAIKSSELSIKGARTEEDIAALSSWTRRMTGIDKAIRTVRLADQNRVIQAGVFQGSGEVGLPFLRSSDLDILRGKPKLFGNWRNPFAIPLNAIETFSAFRENIPRLIKFSKDLDRIEAGGSAKIPEWIDVKGMEGYPIEAAGMANRIMFVDYGAVSPQFAQQIRGFLFPFGTFYAKNVSNWAKYALNTKNIYGTNVTADFARNTLGQNKTHLLEVAGKFLPFMALQQIWNNTGERAELEDMMRKEMPWIAHSPHIITGYKDDDGKSTVISFQDPLSMAMQVFGGFDKLPALMTQAIKGEITASEFAEEFGKNIVTGPLKTVWGLFNPFLKIPLELYANKDFFTNQRISKHGLVETAKATDMEHLNYAYDYSKELACYLLKSFFIPFGQYIKVAKSDEFNPEAVEPTGGVGKAIYREAKGLFRTGLEKHPDISLMKERFAAEGEQTEIARKKITEDDLEDYMADQWSNEVKAYGGPITPMNVIGIMFTPKVNQIINDKMKKLQADNQVDFTALNNKLKQIQAQSTPGQPIDVGRINYVPVVPGELRGLYYFQQLTPAEQVNIMVTALQKSLSTNTPNQTRKDILYSMKYLRKISKILSLSKISKMDSPDAWMNFMGMADNTIQNPNPPEELQ